MREKNKKDSKKGSQEMIIGGKRKEEVIKMKSTGVYDNYVSMSVPVRFIAVYKNSVGKWQVWEMVSYHAGQPIAGYRTKWEAMKKASEIADKLGLQLIA